MTGNNYSTPKNPGEKKEMSRRLVREITETATSLGKQTEYAQRLRDINATHSSSITNTLIEQIGLRCEQIGELEGQIDGMIGQIEKLVESFEGDGKPNDEDAQIDPALRNIFKIPEKLTKKGQVVKFLKTKIEELKGVLKELGGERDSLNNIKTSLLQGYA